MSVRLQSKRGHCGINVGRVAGRLGPAEAATAGASEPTVDPDLQRQFRSVVLAVRRRPFCVYDSPRNGRPFSPVLHTESRRERRRGDDALAGFARAAAAVQRPGRNKGSLSDGPIADARGLASTGASMRWRADICGIRAPRRRGTHLGKPAWMSLPTASHPRPAIHIT
jgi:hypothetical protein